MSEIRFLDGYTDFELSQNLADVSHSTAIVGTQFKIRSAVIEECPAANWDIFYDLLALCTAVELGKTSWGIFDSNFSKGSCTGDSSLGTQNLGINNLLPISENPC